MEEFGKTYVKFDKNNKEHVKALKALKNYNFVKNKDYELLIPFTNAYPDLTTFHGIYVNNNTDIYAHYTYMTENFGMNTGLMIGKFDCYIQEGLIYEWNKELTLKWRKIMVKAYGLPYKQKLNEVLEQRRDEYIFNINVDINSQISDIEENNLLLN